MNQCLDYQGIPFRCSYYRRTSHLRRDCTNWTGSVDTKDDKDSPLFNGYMEQEERTHWGASPLEPTNMIQGLTTWDPSLVSCKLSVLFYFLNSLHGNEILLRNYHWWRKLLMD